MKTHHLYLTFVGTIIAGSLLLTGCGSSKPKSTTPFTTTAVGSELPKLGDSKLCILSFSRDGEVDIQGGGIDSTILRHLITDKEWQKNLVDKLVGAQFKAFSDKLGKRFKLIGDQKYQDVTTVIDTNDKTVIANALKAQGAEFGLIVHDRFGWRWKSDDLGIESYWANVECSIVNKSGDVVWEFSSVANIAPPLSIAHVVSGLTAITPSQETIASDYAEFFEALSSLVIKLIEEDTAGEAHKCNTEDYINTEKYHTTVTIFNRKKAN